MVVSSLTKAVRNPSPPGETTHRATAQSFGSRGPLRSRSLHSASNEGVPSLVDVTFSLLLGPRRRLIASRKDSGVEQLPIRHHRRLHADRDERDFTGGEFLTVGEGPERGRRRVE